MNQPAGAGWQDEKQVLQKMTSYFDAPAFIRRVKRVEDAYQSLLDHLVQKRDEKVEFVRLRVGQLAALAGDWNALRPLVAGRDDLALLRALHEELRPKL